MQEPLHQLQEELLRSATVDSVAARYTFRACPRLAPAMPLCMTREILEHARSLRSSVKSRKKGSRCKLLICGESKSNGSFFGRRLLELGDVAKLLRCRCEV